MTRFELDLDASLADGIVLPQYTSRVEIQRLFANIDDLPDVSKVNYQSIINAASINVEAYIYRNGVYADNEGLARFKNTIIPPGINQRFPNINHRDANMHITMAATYFGIAKIFSLRGETSVRDLDTNTVTETQQDKYTRMAKEQLRGLIADGKNKASIPIGSAQLAVPSYPHDVRGNEHGKVINAFIAGEQDDYKPYNLFFNPQFLIIDNPEGWDFDTADEDVQDITPEMLEQDYFPERNPFDQAVKLNINKPAKETVYITDRNSVTVTALGGEKFQFTHYPWIEIKKDVLYFSEFNLKAIDLTNAQNFYLKILSVDQKERVPKKTTIALGSLEVADDLLCLFGQFVSFDTRGIPINRLPEGHTHFQAYVTSEENLDAGEKIEILSPSVFFEPIEKDDKPSRHTQL